MTAMTRGRPVSERNMRGRRRNMQGNVTIFQGAMVVQSGAVVAPPVVAAASAALKVVGVAETTVSSLQLADGVMTVDIVTGCFEMVNDPADPLTVADTGNPCYASDDQTVAKTNAGNTKAQAGIVADVDDAGVWVRFS